MEIVRIANRKRENVSSNWNQRWIIISKWFLVIVVSKFAVFNIFLSSTLLSVWLICEIHAKRGMTSARKSNFARAMWWIIIFHFFWPFVANILFLNRVLCVRVFAFESHDLCFHRYFRLWWAQTTSHGCLFHFYLFSVVFFFAAPNLLHFIYFVRIQTDVDNSCGIVAKKYTISSYAFKQKTTNKCKYIYHEAAKACDLPYYINESQMPRAHYGK